MTSPIHEQQADGLEFLQVVIAGHVDHGKSTIVGRLLADTGSLPEGRLAQVQDLCARTARPFEYAFLLDALKDERAQGITIDAARVFFRTPRRPYLLLDAPGHVEFIKNMVTGAARAAAALLVIDAREGVRENSRRHGALLALLGVRQVAVLINKMDLVGFDQAAFDRLVQEYGAFLQGAGITASCFIPVHGREGGNVARRSAAMPWYQGPTVLDALESFRSEPPAVAGPLRLPVQDVYKFTAQGDDRRILAGTVESGVLRRGDEVVFYPSGKRARVRTIEAFHRPPQESAAAGHATGFTLDEQLYVPRGEVAAHPGQPPQVASRLRVSLFWLGRTPLCAGREYVLKLGTARVAVQVEAIHRSLDLGDTGADLAYADAPTQVQRHEAAECTLALARPIAVDLGEVPATSRFVLIEDYEIRGGGIVRQALPAQAREHVPLGEPAAPPSPTLPGPQGPGPRPGPEILYRETSLRSVAKAVSWRVFGTLVTMAVVWFFTRRIEVAATVGGLEMAGKVGLFYLHERLWDRVHLGRRRIRPAVLWLTGLSGAGKSTLADYIYRQLTARGLQCEVLDGDSIRSIFPQTGFSRPEREAHVQRVGYLASRLEAHGIFVIVSLISPYERSRTFVRGLCRNFIEVHVSTPLSECERRDVKGLYARARRGEIKNFTGIDDPYEPPLRPELELDTSALSVKEAGARILARLVRGL